MSVIQDVASQGVQNNRQDGAPVAAATINSVNVPDGSLDGTGTYQTSTPSDAPGAGSVDTGSVGTGSVDTGAPTAEPTTGGAG